jgi:hypothetical protein
MGNFRIGTLLVPLILSLTASEAAQGPEEQELVFAREVTYIGPVLDDSALTQRLAQSEPALRANMLETLRPLKLVWKAEEDHE